MPEFDPRNHSVVVYNQAGAVVMKIFVTDSRTRVAVSAERLPPHAPPGTPPEVVAGREAEVFKALVETIAGIVAPASRKQLPPAKLMPRNGHEFIQTGDKDSHRHIQDPNGEVVLAECRKCGQAEGTLTEKCPADEANYTSSDFPTRGCRNCGKKDRPQYKGICNDANCDREF